MSRIAIIAGEASGDLNGSLLARHLREMQPGVELWGAGGKRMREAGVDLIWESGSTGAVGIMESLKLVPGLLIEFARVKAELLRRRPDALTLIDFGAFNKRVAAFARRQGIKTIYYLPPGAWRRRPRKTSQAGLADKLITPFEWSYEALRDAGADVTLIGHPLLDVVKPSLTEEQFRAQVGMPPDAPIVGLLPGSRKQEIRHNLPAMLAAAVLMTERLPAACFVIAAAGRSQAETIERVRAGASRRSGLPDIGVVESLTYDVLAHSRVAITASGTATLEAAILNTPMVIIYRGGLLSHIEYLIRGKAVLEDHIGLPNIIAGKRICPELLSKQASPEKIASLATELLSDPSKSAKMRKDLSAVRSALGAEGGARIAAKVALEAASPGTTS